MTALDVATPRHPSTRRPGMSEAYWRHIQQHAESAPVLTAAQRDAIRRAVAPVLAEIAAEQPRSAA